MQRSDFLRATGAMGLAVGLEGSRGVVQAQKTTTPSTLLWAVKGASTSWLEYGQTTQLGLRADNDEDGLRPYSSPIHRITLRNLKPGTRYYYRAHTRAIDFNRFTADGNTQMHINASVSGDTFILQNGGTTKNVTPLKTLIQRNVAGLDLPAAAQYPKSL